MATLHHFETIKSRLAQSLKEALGRDIITPAGEKHIYCDMHIPYHQLLSNDDEDDQATAVVTYIVKCPTEKKHTVRIRFNYDKTGRFLSDTMQYV